MRVPAPPPPTLEEIARNAYREIDSGLAIESFLETGNARDLEGTFNDTQAAYVLLQVRSAMVDRLNLLVMRLHDPARDQRMSLTQAFALLASGPTRDRVIAQALPRHVVGHMPEPSGEIDALQRAWSDHLAAHIDALRRLRERRDYTLAHSIALPVDQPYYDDLFGVLEGTASIVSRLADLAGVCTVRFNGTRDIWAARAGAYYDALLSGGDALRNDERWRIGRP